MTTTGNRLRQSPHNNAFDIGLAYFRKFAFYAGPSGGQYAVDLEAYDTVKMIVFDSSNVTVDAFTCTVLTAAAQKEADADGTLVANKCTCTVLPTGAAGDYWFHIVGTSSGTAYQLSKPAPVGYYAATPVT